jgi:peptidoglycan hydrolase-like protein with peptidoglycan-binding domain/spore germination protein YaaH
MSHSTKFWAPFFVAAFFVLALIPAAASARTLEMGMSGPDVTALQKALVTKGYLTASPNGNFGPATLAAVRKFQCAQGIVCSGASYGVVGPKTQAALGLTGTVAAPNTPVSTPIASVAARTLKLGMSGADVTAAQQALISKGYLTAAATGYFGPATQAAVRKFQCSIGIICSGSAYGTVGPQTRAALGLGSAIGGLEITGWIPYWRKEKGVAEAVAHITQFTSVMPFGYTVLPDGRINDAMNWGIEPWTTLVVAARANSVKIIPTVMWSNAEAIHATLSDPGRRAAHIENIIVLAEDNKFDGIDIDYEGKYAMTKPYFSLFLKELSARLGSKTLSCTIEARTPLEDMYDGLPPADMIGKVANDFMEINKYCDRVQLMTYDQQTADVSLNKAASSSPYIPVSDPRWIEKVIALTSKDIAKNKLSIGIATYGYEWEATPLQISGFRYDMQWAFNPAYATEIQQKFGVRAVRNMAGELSIAYLPTALAVTTPPTDETTATTASNNPKAKITTTSSNDTPPAIAPSFNILWWSDSVAIAQKVALAQRLGIRGVAIFKLDGGGDPGMWGVLPRPAK